MKRFVLYLVLVPITVMSGGNPFNLLLRLPGYFLWSAYTSWLVTALAMATADRLLQSDRWLRLGTIAAVGYVSTFLTEAALYGLFPRGWRWGGVIAGSHWCDCRTRLLLVTRSIEQRTLKKIRFGDP